MKIRELEQRCGMCELIDYCAEPFDALCLCTDSRLADVDVGVYKKYAKDNRKLSNAEILEAFCCQVKMEGTE